MEPEYPPVEADQLERLKAQLRRTPRQFREDALQQAWLVHLEGGNPVSAVRYYAAKERLYERRHMDFSQTDTETLSEVEKVVDTAAWAPNT